MNQVGKLEWIQALRGVAALLVVLCHGRMYLSARPDFQDIQELLLPGAMGVDLFFIISGFIMVYATRNLNGGARTVVEFLIKRFSRIWPVYLIATLLWVLVTNQIATLFSTSVGVDALFKSLLFLPVNENRALFVEPVLSLGWTLDFEMYFYTIFAFSLMFSAKRLWLVGMWIGLTVLLVPYYLGVFTVNPLVSHVYAVSYMNIITNPIVLEFFAGCCIAQVYISDRVRISNPTVAYCLISVSIALMLWWNYAETGVLHGINRWGGSLAFMVLIFAIASKTVHIPVPRILVYVGEISFSLYLMHLSARVILDWVVVKLGAAAMMNSWSYVLLTTVVAVCVGGLSYKYLEQGFSEWVRAKLTALLPTSGKDGRLVH